MMKTTHQTVALLLAAGLSFVRCDSAVGADAVPTPPPACRVIIVGGLPGSSVMARRFTDWTTRFRTWCVDKAGVPAANIVVLSGDPQAKPAPCTADGVVSAIAEMAERTSPTDQFVLFLVGHGDAVDGEAAFAMPGRNLRATELRAALDRVPAQRIVVLHFGAAAGDALTTLVAKDRVLVAATAPGETADPVFAEFFLLALERELPAGASVLDAYNHAAHETARWIRRLYQTETGTWHLNGKRSIAIFHKLCDGPEEAAGARPLDPSSQPVEPEPDPPLITPADPAAAARLKIPARVRILDEHATLVDNGREGGITAVNEKGFVAVPGTQEGEPGFLAAHTILGHP